MIPIKWLAGFFDGEGCISMTIVGKHRRVAVRIQLTNTNAALLRRIKKEYGGIFVQKTFKHKPHWKPYCALLWTSRKAEVFLEQIFEHLILKRKQAVLARQFFKLRHSLGRLESGSVEGVPRSERSYRARLRPEVVEKEASMKVEMHKLNKKGVPI